MITAKTFISFASRSARGIVQKVLEQHPKLGLTSQEIFQQVHEQFPGAKENPGFLPPTAKVILENRARGPNLHPKHLDIPHVEHPIRSMRFLKKVVLEQMLQRGELQRLYISRSSNDRDLNRVKVLKGNEPVWDPVPNVLPPGVREQWRWRLPPGHVFTDTQDPEPSDVYEAQSTTRKSGNHHGRSNRFRERAYVPPPDRVFGLGERR
ncbi:hypothetical protein Moror_17468 [Moniliophthora roreri MCA 2997]|uniref:Uncharacterized protein n=2 Tax=Moniliophthora roreri TaxID=221103 RepID=V2XXL8_MONRO|nr:hypothetical protein Moror_17468 [Moniliophthora roreri MCA 2997]KAI3612424.1 hypothetical protein WG66_009889 [Moniliophthora roreri]